MNETINSKTIYIDPKNSVAVEGFTNIPKERKGVITSVSEVDGNNCIEICSTEYNRSRQELTLDIVGPTPAWAILGSELEYETGHE